MATGTGNLDTRNLFFEGEVRRAGPAFQLRWAVVNSGDQDLGARRAGEFLFLPFSSGQRVVNTHPRIAQGAVEFTQAHRQHALAFRAGEGGWGHL